MKTKRKGKSFGEWDVWVTLWSGAKEDKPSDSLTALMNFDPQAFPTVHRLLLIFATQPVTTSTPERTFFTLRRLKTWLRSTIREDRLTGLIGVPKGRAESKLPLPKLLGGRRRQCRPLPPPRSRTRCRKRAVQGFEPWILTKIFISAQLHKNDPKVGGNRLNENFKVL